MQFQTVELGRAVHWYGAGWHSFLAAPIPWIGISVIYFVIVAILGWVPLGGPLLAVVSPLFTAGMLFAAREAHARRPIPIAHLFYGFTHDKIRTRLLILGAIVLAVLVVMSLLGWLLFGVQGTTMLSLRLLIGYLLMFAVTIALSLGMAYAVPLVVFSDTPPVEALTSSLRACLINIIPLTLFGLMSFIFAVMAAIPIGLGLLIFIPVMICALYESFDEIYDLAA